jgi:hypothetical protein
MSSGSVVDMKPDELLKIATGLDTIAGILKTVSGVLEAQMYILRLSGTLPTSSRSSTSLLSGWANCQMTLGSPLRSGKPLPRDKAAQFDAARFQPERCTTTR